jgi:hypothetical protein
MGARKGLENIGLGHDVIYFFCYSNGNHLAEACCYPDVIFPREHILRALSKMCCEYARQFQERLTQVF